MRTLTILFLIIEMLTQVIFFNFKIGEISCPTRYFPEASSINFKRSVIYGLGVLATAVRFRLQKHNLAHFSIFESPNQKTIQRYYSEIK